MIAAIYKDYDREISQEFLLRAAEATKSFYNRKSVANNLFKMILGVGTV
ncbi:hypothetical protein [Carnobacterium jeotgali]|nr:hypothetical protein [Carnobacterium jeotgali]